MTLNNRLVEQTTGADKRYFTGIGARSTPASLIPVIMDICRDMVANGFVLRSGGATGCDSYFEQAYLDLGGEMEIYLPWPNFNGNKSPLNSVSAEALQIASKYHPYWRHLTQVVKKLHGRNAYQVLGRDLATPSERVICYTSDGKASGGSGQAIRIAEGYGIPVDNLYAAPQPELFDDTPSSDNNPNKQVSKWTLL